MGSNSILGVAVCMLVAGATNAMAQSQPTGSWAAEASGDYFYMGRGCSDGTYLYILGGYQGVGSTQAEYYARFRRYDPVNNAWFTMPQIAAGTTTGSAVWGTQYHAAEYHSYNGTNRIFIFGGYNYTGSVGSTSYSAGYTNAIRMFTFTSATTGTWTTLSTTLSSTRYYHTALTYQDRIYIMGGVSSNANEIFNPTNLTMSQGTTMPGYLYYHGAAAVPALGKIYVMAGYGVAGYTGINYEYTPQDNDPTTNDTGGTWTTRANISNGTTQQNVYYGPGVLNLNNRIYVLAGINQSNNQQNNVFEYNPFTNTWAQRASTAYGHYGWPGAAAINGKAYLYGGYPSYFYGEEFTPPDFGSPPNVPSIVTQTGARAETALQAQADQSQFDGWTNTQITFSANVTDPNANQQVRFRVQVKPQAASWNTASAITNLDTGLTAQGVLALNYTIPAGGGYDWRWRVEDAYQNSYPLTPNSWVEAFGTFANQNTNSPDFRSDQVAPADPVAVFPTNLDIQVPDPNVGDVTLNWIESTDNGPVAGISYELQVARDGAFIDIEAQLFSTAGQSSYPIQLSVSRYEKHWRIRARDVGGNFSQWSQPLIFRVTYNDGDNHSAGDAAKVCGSSATGSPALASALLGLAILAMAARRKLA